MLPVSRRIAMATAPQTARRVTIGSFRGLEKLTEHNVRSETRPQDTAEF